MLQNRQVTSIRQLDIEVALGKGPSLILKNFQNKNVVIGIKTLIFSIVMILFIVT